MPDSGSLPSHLSSTFVILPPSWKMLTLLVMVVSLPRPLTLYMVVMSISIGLPAEVTLWDLRSMAEKAVWRPYCFCRELWLERGGLVSLFGWDGGTYPLRLKLFPALGYGDGVGEDCIVFPELQLG